MCHSAKLSTVIHFKKIIFDFREKGRERKRGRETSMWERNNNWLPSVHALGTQACSLGMCPNWELNQWPLVHGTMPKQLSHTGQGQRFAFLFYRPYFLLFYSTAYLQIESWYTYEDVADSATGWGIGEDSMHRLFLQFPCLTSQRAC